MPYFEDIKIGTSAELGSFSFTEENIKAFAQKFDPQPIHLDGEAGRKAGLGGITASGWHVSAAYMKLLVAKIQRETAENVALGKPLIPAGPSPGFRDMKWIKPVFAGDTLTYRIEAATTRALASRPEWGLAESQVTAVNQNGELVFSFIASGFIARRPAS